MPPRRSCFLPHPPPGRGPAGGFQCHHGVPASGSVDAILTELHDGFNATTAFLLPGSDGLPVDLWVAVSMPPRRSCFLVDGHWKCFVCGVSMPPRRSCFKGVGPCGVGGGRGFNATTAFLLRPVCGLAILNT